MQQKTEINKRILVTGGGSGGHVSVATAFIDALEDKYTNVKENLLYVGSDLGMVGEKAGISIEQRRMADRDINFRTIRAGKLQRRFEFETVKLLFRTVLGVYDSFKLVKEFSPDIIFCTGGYLSVPIAFAGWVNKIPVYLHEQTAAVGLSNGIVAKLAKRVYISFKSSEKYFPKGKTLLTGNIVRDSIFKSDGGGEICKAVSKMKDSNLPVIYISGGGQGSHILNLLVREIMAYALHKYQIILQTGDNQTLRDYDLLYKEWMKLPTNLKERMYVTKFVSDSEIGCVFNNSDMYVGRAGANTVYEIGVLQKPSIFIPIPWVTHNEQELNARILESYGLSKVVLEGEITAGKLDSEIKKMLGRMETLEVDRKGIESEFVLGAQKRILDDMLG
jgi:UDP-N-acetylglucosamine--N-acetylmuramyl-(pentapeptide) pyrophosphoryl-undecaprenol N-acetylglucosamine transferase